MSETGSGEQDRRRATLDQTPKPEDFVLRAHPLRQRSQSQNNTLAIRVVPYTPPRLSAQSRTPSQSSSQIIADDDALHSDEQATTTARSSWSRRASDRSERPFASLASGTSSPSSSTTALARSWEGAGGVSGAKLATGPGAQPTPAPRPPAKFDYNRSINASATAQTDDEQDEPFSPASSTTSTQKSSIRRGNFIAVHADKTFSLVPLRPPSYPHSGIKSPPLSLSTVRSSSSQERLSSFAFSDDRLSSATTTTFPDLSQSAYTPSPRSSTTQLAEDPAPPSPGHDRSIGGLRKVPKTPDTKQKKTAAYLAAAQETPLPPLPETETSSNPSFEETTLAEQGDSSPAAGASSPEAEESSPAVEDTSAFSDQTQLRLVIPKNSFNSTSGESVSTLSETTNYKVYEYSPSPVAQDSTDSLRPPSSCGSNVQLLGASSPAAPVFEGTPISLRTPASNQNYVVYGDPSPTPASQKNYVVYGDPSPTPASQRNYIVYGDPSPTPSATPTPQQPRATYSQESLLVPPLQTTRRSPEKFAYYKSRSRESLRRAASLKSIQSISSVISHDANSPLIVAPAFVDYATTSSSGRSEDQDQPEAWEYTPEPQTPIHQARRVQMVETHPHQWSSQLSTVMSEDEESSHRTGSQSRSVSMLSSSPAGSGGGGGHRRRSSGGWASSTHSRQMLSISSSLAGQLEETESLSRSHSRSDSLERPQPTYSRGSNPNGGSRTVRDVDEHGDGLADLRQQVSRAGLSAFFSSSNSSGRNLPSSSNSSSRANSISSGVIPNWARVYYGSGEQRRLIGAQSISEDSMDGGLRGVFLGPAPGPAPGPPPPPTTRKMSSSRGRSESPGQDYFPMNLYAKRKRAKQQAQGQGGGLLSDAASLDVGSPPLPPPPHPEHEYKGGARLRQKTSSIWSPHLRFDRRASRYSIWEPPSVSWSAESGLMGRRNSQVILFLVGFIFPFAWMIAAFLPLPPKAHAQQMLERSLHDQPGGDEYGVPEAFKQQLLTADEVRYQSARWWRNLNRVMAVIGLLLIGAVIALVVVGVRQGWGR